MKQLCVVCLVLFSGPQLANGEQLIWLFATAPDHPWGTHMYEFDCGVLATCLNQHPGVKAKVFMDWPGFANLPDDLRSVVFYSRPVGEIVLGPDHYPNFQRLMKRGVGFVAIHWGTGVGYSKFADQPKIREAYKNILGGWFRRPPSGITVGISLLTQLVPDHPICRGWQEYDIRDEFYLDLIFHPKIEPILQVQVDGNPQTVAWSFERPDNQQGRSFGTTLGHFHENFMRPSFRKMLVNGILWSAHVELPIGGANVNVAPSKLTLPTKIPDQESN